MTLTADVLTVSQLVAQLSTFPPDAEVRVFTHGQHAAFALTIESIEGGVVIGGGWRQKCTRCAHALKDHSDSLRCRVCKDECGINCNSQGRLI